MQMNKHYFTQTIHLYYNVLRYVTELWLKAKVITKASSKKFILKVSTTMLMEHVLCDDLGGKHNVCGMEKLNEKVIFQNYPLKICVKIC
tara:strand:- start:182 stop:448 length:267 start_codon:yes stop_codon:yes gene_type:complete